MTRPTQTDIANALDRLAKLEAAEEQRIQTAEAERRARELQQERQGPAVKRVTKEGEGTGQAQCINEGCPELYVRQPVELTFSETTQFQKEPDGSVSDRPENSWTHWHLKDDADGRCPNCDNPRNLIPPGAKTWWDGTSRRGASDLENLRKLRNLEIQRVEVVERVEQANLEVQKAVEDS
jgi:hypothetical protein